MISLISVQLCVRPHSPHAYSVEPRVLALLPFDSIQEHSASQCCGFRPQWSLHLPSQENLHCQASFVHTIRLRYIAGHYRHRVTLLVNTSATTVLILRRVRILLTTGKIDLAALPNPQKQIRCMHFGHATNCSLASLLAKLCLTFSCGTQQPADLVSSSVVVPSPCKTPTSHRHRLRVEDEANSLHWHHAMRRLPLVANGRARRPIDRPGFRTVHEPAVGRVELGK